LRDLIRHTYLSRITIQWRLTGSLGLTIRHLLWVPHCLTNAQKENRDNLSK
jgi:hypothetical protein